MKEKDELMKLGKAMNKALKNLELECNKSGIEYTLFMTRVKEKDGFFFCNTSELDNIVDFMLTIVESNDDNARIFKNIITDVACHLVRNDKSVLFGLLQAAGATVINGNGLGGLMTSMEAN